MANANFSFAWQASLTEDSSILLTGGSLDAVKLTSFTTGTVIYRRITLAPYASAANVVKLWDYTQGDWSSFIVQVVDLCLIHVEISAGIIVGSLFDIVVEWAATNVERSL
jgi:hypothetical protein